MEDIYGGCESSAPYHHVNNFAGTHSDANIFPLGESFIELKDFEAPLTSVDVPAPSGHNHSERCLYAFDRSIAAQNFWMQVNSDDANVPGMWLTDLESPLTRFSEAGQSNQAYVDASFSDEGFGTISNPPVAEDFRSLSQYSRLEPFKGYMDMPWEVSTGIYILNIFPPS